MLQVHLTLLLACLTAALLIPRDYSTVQHDLFNLYASADGVVSGAKAANGTLSSNAPVLNYELYLSDNFTDTVRDIRSVTTTFTTAQFKALLGNITSTLYPKLRNALNAVKPIRPYFYRNGEDGIEQYILSSLSVEVSSFGMVIVTKAPTAYISSASRVSASLTTLLSSATSAYAAAPTTT